MKKQEKGGAAAYADKRDFTKPLDFRFLEIQVAVAFNHDQRLDPRRWPRNTIT